MSTRQPTAREARDFQRSLRHLATNRVRARHWEKRWVDTGHLRLYKWVPIEDRKTTGLAMETSLMATEMPNRALAYRRRSLRQLGKQLAEGSDSAFDTTALLDNPSGSTSSIFAAIASNSAAIVDSPTEPPVDDEDVFPATVPIPHHEQDSQEPSQSESEASSSQSQSESQSQDNEASNRKRLRNEDGGEGSEQANGEEESEEQRNLRQRTNASD